MGKMPLSAAIAATRLIGIVGLASACPAIARDQYRTLPKSAERAQDHNARSELAFETGAFLKRYQYGRPDAAYPDMAPSGAYAANRSFDSGASDKWYIEEQRYGRDLILGGIAYRDTTKIDRGLRMFQWGFDHQSPDGAFHCIDAYHSTSFFIEGVAHAMLLLRESEFAGRYAAKIADFTPRLRAAGLWMIRPDVAEGAAPKQKPFTHRRYAVAAALGETGALANDATLLEAAAASARVGISQQDPLGFNPEKGGHDSSYNAVGLGYAQRYYSLAAPHGLRPALWDMLRRGIT